MRRPRDQFLYFYNTRGLFNVLKKTQEYLETGPKKHKAGKPIWENYIEDFEKSGFDNIRKNDDFRIKFTLDFILVYGLLQRDSLLKTIPNTQIITKENAFLCFLFKCKTGARNEELSEFFGGKKSFHDNLFRQMVDRLVYYFSPMIKIPTREQADYHRRYLERYSWHNFITIK